jgi:hypothetical protein
MNNRLVLMGGLATGALVASGQTLLLLVPGMEPSGMPLAVSVLRSLLLGCGCVLLYAALLPRFGPGVRTALTAGVFVFLAGVLFPPFEFALRDGGGRDLLIAVVWNAVLVPLATLAGASVYREEPYPGRAVS